MRRHTFVIWKNAPWPCRTRAFSLQPREDAKLPRRHTRFHTGCPTRSPPDWAVGASVHWRGSQSSCASTRTVGQRAPICSQHGCTVASSLQRTNRLQIP
jgi:hypothetical protein